MSWELIVHLSQWELLPVTELDPVGGAIQEVLALDSDVDQTVTPQDVIGQMKLIMVSPEFAVPARAKKFFQYLVDETLAGRADRIKAYSVAIEVFGRDSSFDAQNDPAVRIEAARLRRGLERYYFTGGIHDPIVISIPKGGYVPQFDRREPSLAIIEENSHTNHVESEPFHLYSFRSIGLKIFGSLAVVIAAISVYLFFSQLEANSQGLGGLAPSVLVTTFEDQGVTPESRTIALGLSSEIADQLAKFKEIIVSVGNNSEDGLAPDHPQLELVGSVRTSSDHLRFSLRLQQRSTRQVYWAKTFDERFDVRNLLDFQKQIAVEVATELGQAYGVIIRSGAENLDRFQPQDRKAYLCTLSAFAYRLELQVAEHARLRECLKQTVSRYPDYLVAWTQLALIYLDEDRFGYNPIANEISPLERATIAANRAFALDPSNPRALEAMMTVSYFNGNPDLGKMMGERAMALNPNDMAVISEYGLRLALSGEWKAGAALIERSATYRMDNLNYYKTDLALIAYMQKDYLRAASIIKEVRAKDNPLVYLVASAIYGQAGLAAEAKASSELLIKTGAAIVKNIDAAMAKRNMRETDKFHLIEGLQKAGLPVQSSHYYPTHLSVSKSN